MQSFPDSIRTKIKGKKKIKNKVEREKRKINWSKLSEKWGETEGGNIKTQGKGKMKETGKITKNKKKMNFFLTSFKRNSRNWK